MTSYSSLRQICRRWTRRSFVASHTFAKLHFIDTIQYLGGEEATAIQNDILLGLEGVDTLIRYLKATKKRTTFLPETLRTISIAPAGERLVVCGTVRGDSNGRRKAGSL